MANYHSNKDMVHSYHPQNRYSIDSSIVQSSVHSNHKYPCSNSHHDSQSNIHFISKANDSQQRPSPTASKNMISFNSPAGSKRSSPSSNPDEDDFQIVTRQKKKKQMDLANSSGQQQRHHISPVNMNNSTPSLVRPIAPRTITNSNISNNNKNNQSDPQIHHNVTTASARYAITRFPFPPFIARFKTNKITLKQFKEEIVNHFKNNHQVDIEILNCRSSKTKCNNNDMDILLYIKDSSSFPYLYDQNKWPLTIAGDDYMIPSWSFNPPTTFAYYQGCQHPNRFR